MTATKAATQATTVAWTWRRDKFPRMILRRCLGSSSSPILAAVPSLAERFISRFPLRFMMTGTMMMSSPIVLMAFQRCSSVGPFPHRRGICELTDTWSKSSPVNKRLTVVSSKVGALYAVPSRDLPSHCFGNGHLPRGRCRSLVSTQNCPTALCP